MSGQGSNGVAPPLELGEIEVGQGRENSALASAPKPNYVHYVPANP